MEYDQHKVDEVVLALLTLTSFDDHGITRAWKSHDWDTLDRLYEQGYISDPKNKNKSVVLTNRGREQALQLFDHYFRST